MRNEFISNKEVNYFNPGVEEDDRLINWPDTSKDKKSKKRSKTPVKIPEILKFSIARCV